MDGHRYLNKEAFQRLLDEGRDIYVMEEYSPSASARIFLSKEVLERRYLEHSSKSKIKKMAGNSMFREFLKTDDLLIYELVRDLPGNAEFDK